MSDRYLRDEKQQLLNGIGSELSWGWSPAIDFVELTKGRAGGDAQPRAAIAPVADNSRTNVAADSPEELDELDALMREFESRKASAPAEDDGGGSSGAAPVNVLLAGASDIRHILRTVASLRAQEAAGAAPAEYHFYLYEPNLRTHCRHLFFLQWLLDSMFSFEELEERVLMFLEMFGNSLVREITAAQARGVTQRLLKGLEREEGNLIPLVDFSGMKLKERDFVEQQLLHWGRDASRADIEAQWSSRVRQEMADRYDNRDNLIDWDFVFQLTEYTNLIKFPEYRTWRSTGLAYDVCHINPRKGFSYSYGTVNKTLCHFTRKGDGVYCGDVKNGPFFALGATTENTQICHRTADGTCKYGNGVVAMHNIRAWLFTLMTSKAWPWADHAFAWDDPKNYNYLPSGTPSGVEYKASFPRVKFHFIGLDFDRFVQRCGDTSASEPVMDAVFIGTSCTHLLTPAFFAACVRHGGVVVAETAKFVVDAHEEAKDAFERRIEELATAAGWARDAKLTQLLHKGQPEPRKAQGSPTEAQAQAAKRYHMPFQIALTAR